MMPTTVWSLRVVRAVFFALSVFTGMAIAVGLMYPAWFGALSGAAFVLILILLDQAFSRFSMREFSHATFGLMIGLFCAWLVTRVGFLQLAWFQTLKDSEAVITVVQIVLYAALAYFGICFALRSERDQFAVVIPYVRFRRDSSQSDPLILDTNILIDGRLLAVTDSGFISTTMVVPRFVIDELQRMADSRDPQKAARGKRGLDEVKRLGENPKVELSIHEEIPRSGEGEVDAMLVGLSRDLNARLLTNDENLAKVARLRNLVVLNLNELTLALQPKLNHGDRVMLELVKVGKDKHQAVGYLEDGTMIVVNHAADQIGQRVMVEILGALPTAAGRLFFAELARG